MVQCGYTMCSRRWVHNRVLPGGSPGNELLIMNINKIDTHSTHAHIPVLITASVCSTKQRFYGDVFFFLSIPHFSIWIHKEAKHYSFPWPAFSLSGFVLNLLGCSVWKIHPHLWTFCLPSFSLSQDCISIITLSSEWGCWAKNETLGSVDPLCAHFNWTPVHCYTFLSPLSPCNSVCVDAGARVASWKPVTSEIPSASCSSLCSLPGNLNYRDWTEHSLLHLTLEGGSSVKHCKKEFDAIVKRGGSAVTEVN